MKSISPETLKAVKQACIDFQQHMNYFRNETEISNDNFIFPRLALLCSLSDQIIQHIHE